MDSRDCTVYKYPDEGMLTSWNADTPMASSTAWHASRHLSSGGVLGGWQTGCLAVRPLLPGDNRRAPKDFVPMFTSVKCFQPKELILGP